MNASKVSGFSDRAAQQCVLAQPLLPQRCRRFLLPSNDKTKLFGGNGDLAVERSRLIDWSKLQPPAATICKCQVYVDCVENSDFPIDHNSRGRTHASTKITWDPVKRRPLPQCLSYAPRCHSRIATESCCANARIWSARIFEVVQNRVVGGSSSTKADSIGGDLEEEIRPGLFCWPRYLDGSEASLRS